MYCKYTNNILNKRAAPYPAEENRPKVCEKKTSGTRKKSPDCLLRVVNKMTYAG